MQPAPARTPSSEHPRGAFSAAEVIPQLAAETRDALFQSQVRHGLHLRPLWRTPTAAVS